MAKRQFITADFSEAGAAMGAISGMARTVHTDRYLSDVVKMAHGVLSADFNLHMDGLMALSPNNYHHVYEWNTQGGYKSAATRLWKHSILGHGAVRNATWDWVASKKPIPTPFERSANPHDPMSQLSEEELSKFSDRRYFFFWKAPVMELNRPVNIYPKNGKRIVFPVWDSADPIRSSAGLRNLEPGGPDTTGAFTMAWTAWWGTEAPMRFDEVISPMLEKDLSQAYESVRVGKRARKGRVGLNALANYEDAFAISQEAMEMELYRRSNSYKWRTRGD